MIKRLGQRSRNILGYKLIGKITKADYAKLTADIVDIGQDSANIRLLLDLEAFEGEAIKSQGAKLSFRIRFGEKITKLAIVGDKKWHMWLLTLSERQNYNREMEFFPIDEHEAAWEWLHDS